MCEFILENPLDEEFILSLENNEHLTNREFLEYYEAIDINEYSTANSLDDDFMKALENKEHLKDKEYLEYCESINISNL